MVFGKKKSDKQIVKMVKRVFTELVKNFSEVLYIRDLTKENIDDHISVEGMEHATKALKEGKGIIFLSGHLGCFEIIPIYFAIKGFPITVVGTKLYDKRLDKLLVQNRSKFNIKYVERGKNTMDIIKALKKGEGFGVLFDLDTRTEGVFADFFGKEAFTPVGPMKLAEKFDVPIIPVVIQREKNYHHKITICQRVNINSTGDSEQDLQLMAAECNRIFEKLILQAPDQWIWIHDRWKTKNE